MSHRVELKFAETEPLYAELLSEARARGVNMQQHIFDILKARSLARQGTSISDLLWVPGSAPQRSEREDPPRPDAAKGAADAWLGMIDDEEDL